MRDIKIKYAFLFVSIVVKFLVSLVLLTPFSAFIYSSAFAMVGYFLLRYNMKFHNYLMLVMVDFLLCFLIATNAMGIGLQTILNGFIYFAFGGFFFYLVLAENIARNTNNKALKKLSNIEVDKGIKALESEDYKAAVSYFLKAIKESKYNYLGYMGMCNTLTRFDKYNLRKINYYKKKCIKYAPRELKESINDKF